MKSSKILFIGSICILISLVIALVYYAVSSLKSQIDKEQYALDTILSEYRNT